MRSLDPKAWGAAGATLVAFALATWLADALLDLGGGRAWVLRIGLMVLGLVAAFLVHRLVAARTRRKEEEPAGDARAALDELVRAARRRLGSSTVADTTNLARLPVVVLLGPAGSTKTTTVVQSGLDPELLAGEVWRGETVVPTETANVWYAESTVLVEAGTGAQEPPAVWERLVRHLRPARLGAVLSRGSQAPRAAVVCASCEDLLKPGASEAVPALARALRGRLADMSRRLGIRLPVYVAFTKADRLPYFMDYVRNLSDEEIRQVLGATLPVVDPETVQGTYAEAQGRRVQGAWSELVRSLSEHRLEILRREKDEGVKSGAYEFPRELNKVGERVVEFLVDLCRPSQLSVSPFLRGFYFTGVRPVVVGDAAPTPVSVGDAPALDATSVFDPRKLKEAMAAPRSGGGRKVPQWVFLDRFFPDVVLGDRVARTITGGGARIDLLRRGLAGGAALVGLVLAVGLTVSWLGNRRLEGRTLEAARSLETVPVETGVPGLEALQALDSMRAATARLAAWERDDPPLGLEWGLYRGSALFPSAREIYFARFRDLLWSDAESALTAELGDLPDAPDAAGDYGRTYDDLKAYLVTTSHPGESEPDFLTPVMLRHLPGAADLDPERMELVRRQFDFYATELPYGNPFAVSPDERLVERSRAYLGRFAEGDRFYQAMINRASEAGEAVQFAQLYPSASGVVSNGAVVPGAFTEEGWSFIQQNLGDVDELFSREEWVVGAGSVSAEDLDRMAAQLRERYVTEYVERWTEYLRSGSVSGFGGPQDASRKLAVLSGNQSPLLQMLALASRHTAVDSTDVGRSFQPLHLVVPPGVTDRLISEANGSYMSALAGLQTAMDQVAEAPAPERGPAMSQAASSADQAKLAVRDLARDFRIEGAAGSVGNRVTALLESPVENAERLIGALPVAEANGKGRALCATFGAVTAKYPFAPGSRVDATVDEVDALLQPGGSALTNFHDDVLRDLVVRQGSRYTARSGATPTPTPEFLAFFNRASEASEALYGAAGDGARVTFALRPQMSEALTELTVTLDGRSERFTRTQAPFRTFTWEGSRARSARITGTVNGRETVLLSAPEGPWALWRLFQDARWERTAARQYRVTWPVPGEPVDLVVDLSLAMDAPIFRSDYLGSLDCVPRVAR